MGIDINPHSVGLASFTAKLNAFGSYRILKADALALFGVLGTLNLVSWNLPFIFMPDECKDTAIDGYGGNLVIGLCLDFIETLSGLLNDEGTTCTALDPKRP